MTTATMTMPTTTLSSSRRTHGGRVVNARSKDDVIERFFQWGEIAFCAPRDIKSTDVVEDPDVLDYVFDQVESFTCAEGRRVVPNNGRDGEVLLAGGNNSFNDDANSLKRENSLLEHGPNGAPAVRFATTSTTTRSKQPVVAALGQEGDLLDYCFEHVESYVEAHACSEGNEVGEYSAGAGRRINNKKSKSSSKNNNRSKEGNNINARAQAAIEAQLQQQVKRDAMDVVQTNGNSNNKRGSWFFSKSSSGKSRSVSPESSHPIPSEISTKMKQQQQQQQAVVEEEDSVQLYFRPSRRH